MRSQTLKFQLGLVWFALGALAACGPASTNPHPRVAAIPSVPASQTQAFSDFHARYCQSDLSVIPDFSVRGSIKITEYAKQPAPELDSLFLGDDWAAWRALPELSTDERMALRAELGIDQGALNLDLPDFWGARRIGADLLESLPDLSAKNQLGILDSDFAPAHVGLTGRIAKTLLALDDGKDGFHGAHVSGTVAAAAPFGIGQGGNFKIVLGSYRDEIGVKSTPYEDVLLRRMENLASVEGGLRGMSASLRFGDDTSYVAGVERLLRAHGLFLVNASGNSRHLLDQSQERFVDPEQSHVIFVGSVSPFGPVSSFSNFGTPLFISAPGEQIFSIDRGGATPARATRARYTWSDGETSTITTLSGTSMATPHVAATAMLVLDAAPHLGPNEVMRVLALTAIDKGTPGKDIFFGYGQVNALGAVRLAQALGRGKKEADALVAMRADSRAAWQRAKHALGLAVNALGAVAHRESLANASRALREAYFLDPQNLDIRRALEIFELKTGSRIEAMAYGFDLFTLTGDRRYWDLSFDGSDTAAQLFEDGKRVLSGPAFVKFARTEGFSRKLKVAIECAEQGAIACGDAPIRTEAELLETVEAFRQARTPEVRAAITQWIISDFLRQPSEIMTGQRPVNLPSLRIAPVLKRILAQSPTRDRIEFVLRVSWRISPALTFPVELLRPYLVSPAAELRYLALTASSDLVPRDGDYYRWLETSSVLPDALAARLCTNSPAYGARAVFASIRLTQAPMGLLSQAKGLLLSYWASLSLEDRVQLIGADPSFALEFKRLAAPGFPDAVRTWNANQSDWTEQFEAALQRFPEELKAPDGVALLDQIDQKLLKNSGLSAELNIQLQQAVYLAARGQLDAAIVQHRIRAAVQSLLKFRTGDSGSSENLTEFMRPLRRRWNSVTDPVFLRELIEDLTAAAGYSDSERTEWAEANALWISPSSFEGFALSEGSASADALIESLLAQLNKATTRPAAEWSLLRKALVMITPWGLSADERAEKLALGLRGLAQNAESPLQKDALTMLWVLYPQRMAAGATLPPTMETLTEAAKRITLPLYYRFPGAAMNRLDLRHMAVEQFMALRGEAGFVAIMTLTLADLPASSRDGLNARFVEVFFGASDPGTWSLAYRAILNTRTSRTAEWLKAELPAAAPARKQDVWQALRREIEENRFEP